MRLSFLIILVTLFWSCGSSEDNDTSDRAIRSTFDVIDTRISSTDSQEAFNKDTSSLVGFDPRGGENRMLLYFPKVEELYEDDVIITSITNIELLVHCADVPVHPNSIKIYPLTRPWTAYSNWNSYFALVPGSEWEQPGGDFDSSVAISSPAIRTNTDDSSVFELSFDITEHITSMVTQNKPNYGYVVLVEKSELNGSDAMTFFTSNSGNGAARPSAILAFSTKDIVVDE
jgi:hypothetical protein